MTPELCSRCGKAAESACDCYLLECPAAAEEVSWVRAFQQLGQHRPGLPAVDAGAD